MSLNLTNFQVFWKSVLEEDPDRAVCKVPGESSAQLLSFRAAAIYRRALRFASGFHQELHLVAGDRVALLIDDPADLAVALHGCWLPGFVPIPLSQDLSDDEIVTLLNNLSVKVVVFPPAMSARVAGMFKRTFSTKDWVVTSGGMGAASGGMVRKLDEILAGNPAAELPDSLVSEEDCQGLIVLSRGTIAAARGASFSQTSVLKAAQAMTRFHPGAETGFARSLLPLQTLASLLLNFVTPLLGGGFSVVSHDFDLKNFWDRVRTEGLTHVLVSQDQLREIVRRGKLRSWVAPTGLTIGLIASSPISSELLATFEKRFGFPVVPTYYLTEAGGLVTAFPKTEDGVYCSKWLYDYYLPSSGVPVPGVEIVIADLEGRALKEEVLGEILVRSDQSMSAYAGTQAGEAYFGQKSLLHTGDEGFYVRDQAGQKHVFATGRLSELIIRNNQRINPSRIETMIADIDGVEFAKVVGFPNLHSGYEVGAYVVPLKTSNVGDEKIMRKLRDALDWVECPKVILMGLRPPEGAFPSRAELVPLFSKYYSVDYSRGE